MIRKFLFWVHLVLGVMAGVFIFIMAATGVVLAFEKQITDWVDRDLRWVSVPQAVPLRPIDDLLKAVERAGVGEPTAIVVRNAPQATAQFSIGRGKIIYVDPYSGAILRASSAAAHGFFVEIERWHRTLGAPLGSKGIGHWLAAISNLLFGGLILLGVVLWFLRQWSGKALRASLVFRSGLHGRARDWNWHNVLGIWFAAPLLIIVVTGVVMSFEWANALLFRWSGSTPAVQGRGPADNHRHGRDTQIGDEPNYDRLLALSTTFVPNWRTITLNIARGVNAPVPVTVDTGTGEQPQKRTQYLLHRKTGAVLRTTTFTDGTLGQRLRAFVRFGHTGEWVGWAGQLIAAVASLAACLLVYTGLSLSIRRLRARLKRKRNSAAASGPHTEQLVIERHA